MENTTPENAVNETARPEEITSAFKQLMQKGWELPMVKECTANWITVEWQPNDDPYISTNDTGISFSRDTLDEEQFTELCTFMAELQNHPYWEWEGDREMTYSAVTYTIKDHTCEYNWSIGETVYA